MTKKFIVVVVPAILVAGGLLLRWSNHSPLAAVTGASIGVNTNRGEVPGQVASNAVARASSLSRAREFDATVNPYAAALREPGNSKRSWEADFLSRWQNASEGDSIRFELTQGRTAIGAIRIIQRRAGELTYVSGDLTEPEAGRFFFLKPPDGGKAGKAVGVIEFPQSKTAYRLEPTGPNGDPELWQRRLDEVVCLNMPLADESTLTNQIANLPPLRPDLVPAIVPAYNTNLQNKALVSLQSLPGSKAVLLLDFFGGYTPTWGGVSYPAPNVGNDQIKDVWKRVAEDFLPFNINVTTDIKTYQAAPASSRQRCVFTPSTSAVGSGAAGVAYVGSWNWGSDTVCWSIYTSGKPGAEVGAHEPGHTLGLGHQGQGDSTGTTNEYYGGHGNGVTGWAPTMGVGYSKPVSSWAKGEYQFANNKQDELSVIVSQNNNVDYRSDDTGSSLTGARYLEIYPDFAAMAEGVIETAGDTDAFQFTTTGGAVALIANPVGDWADLAVSVTLSDESDNVIASDNPQSTLSASINTTVPAGTYTFRITGTGRNDPLNTGFSAYASLGYYSIAGFVEGARLPTRLSVFEHVPNGTAVGLVEPNSPADALQFTILSGNSNGTFAIDASGVVSVANSAALDYQKLASNNTFAVQYELFINLTNLDHPELTELNRRVVIAVQSTNLNYPLDFTGFNAGVIAPFDASPSVPKATGFDIANNYSLYQAGLNFNPQVGGSGGGQGLPANGLVLSQTDGTTFKLGPFGGTNALMLGYTYPRFGTLTLATPQPFNSLAILAASANGGGLGTFVLNFTNGTRSQVFNFNAQDWFNTVNNVGVQGYGRLKLGQGTLNTENPGWNNPNLYQTTLDLAALGLNQTVASITFTNPLGGGTLDTGIFAVSGSVMPPQVNITRQPQSLTNNLPAQGVSFYATAMGAPPLYWQWYFSSNGSPNTFFALEGRTGTNLLLNAELQSSNAGSYRVVVTNNFGSATSTVATLTLYREPVITGPLTPNNLKLFAGRSVGLSLAAHAALPVSYYWRTNGVNFTVTTSPALTLGYLQPSHSADYTVVVSNAYGMATSSVAAITVIATPTDRPYVQAVLAHQPLGYWRLNETSGSVAYDYVHGNNGTYNGVTLNQAGYHPVDTDSAARFGPGLNSYVGGIPIDFATNGSAAFSVEAWVKGVAQTTDAGLITKGTGAGGEQFNLDTGAGGHAFRFFVRDAGGGAHLANGTIAPNNNWQHLVGVCNQSAGQVILYVNGISNASATISAGSGLLASSNAVSFGSRQQGTGSYNFQFNGAMDEVAIYGYALTPAQVAAHYAVRTNVPPIFAADPFTRPAAQAGHAYNASLVGAAGDPNNDALTYAKVNGPAWLSVAGAGTLTGTPVSANFGTNSFVVKATDPAGLFATATLNLNVTAADPISLAVAFAGTNLSLKWTGGASPYEVQMTTNLASPVWETVAFPVPGNTLVIAPTNPAAYFRIYGQ